MKLNKSKNKGKVHPSPSSSPSSSAINNVDDPISSLNHLLPTAILTLISILSLQDREALAYMIIHSLKSSTLNYCSSSNFDQKIKKKPNKKSSSSSSSSIIATTANHSSPCFDCCCFDCFSHFWNRWDSSPHSELIHQAIEAFEEHLSSTEKTKTTSSKKTKNNNGKSSSRKKNRMVSSADVEERESCVTPEILISAVVDDDIKEESSKINEVKEVWSPEILGMADVEERENEENLVSVDGEDEESGARKELQQQQQQHKGLARKVLPDVIGLFHSRFWKNLWGPNV